MLSAMEQSAEAIPYGDDEAVIAGIHFTPSRFVRPPRIADSHVSFECKLERIVRVTEGPDAGNLIIGRVLLMHAEDGIVKAGREIDWVGLDPLGRLSGNRYCAIRTVIESETN
jgi:flavin reductase (DIM6/NTAB) family NADH-FMN oxidoreductase RutF